MSASLSMKTEETGEDSCNTMTAENRPKYGPRSRSPMWWIGVAAVSLGLLLLFVTFVVVVHNAGTPCHPSTLPVGMIHYEQQIYNLTSDKETLTDELQRLKMNSTMLTKDMDILRSQYKAVSDIRDHLELEVQRLAEGFTREGKLCHLGWVKFNNKCYYASEKGQAKSWEESRKDCQQRRSDLVIITSKEELDFIKGIQSKTWIGLSDSLEEGKWKWVDGSKLTGTGFWQTGEPNNAGNEDCVEIKSSNALWNDAICTDNVPWICED